MQEIQIFMFYKLKLGGLMMQNIKHIVFSLAIILLITSTLYGQSGRKRPDQPSLPAQPSTTNPTKPAEPRKNDSTSSPSNITTNPTKPTTNNTPGKVLVPSGAAITAQEIAGITSRFVFKNGVTVIVREDHSVPLVAATVMVKSGTSYESEDELGVSRVVERVLTESATSEDDPLRQLRRLGGILTSKTDFESSNYSLLAQSSGFAKLLEMHFRNLQRPSFTGEDVTRAAKYVLQANRYKLDDPFSYSQQRILQAAFDHNPSSSILDDAKLITKEQAQAFYDRYYRGGNVIVVVVGDVNSDAVRLIAQQFLGAIKPSENHSKPISKPAEGTPIRYLAERADINQTVVSVGYRVPGIKDAAVFEVLSAILTQGRGASLPQALIEPSFASKVAAQYVASNKGSLFSFQMQVVPERLVKAEDALFEQIEALRRVILSPGDLQRAKSLLEKDYYDGTLNLTRLSEQLASWESRGSYKNFDNYVKRLKTVTAEQVQQLASQYFSFSAAIVHEYEPRNAPARTAGSDPIYTPDRFDSYIKVLVPSVNKETISKDDIIYAPEKALVKQGKDRFEQTTEGGFLLDLQPQPVKDFSTLRGPRAFVREDPSRPLLAIGFYFQGGRILEKETNEGITELMLRSILRGTQRQTGAELALTLEQLGAELKIVNEPDFFGYNLEVLSRNAEPAMKLVIATIENALFDKDEFLREKASLLAAIQAKRDDGLSSAVDLTNKVLYSGHPYATAQLGLENSVAQFSEADIVDWYQKTVKRQLPLVVIVGDTEGSALVGRLIADGFIRQDQQLDKAIAIPVVTPRNTAGEKVETRERRQTAQVINFSGPEGKSADCYVLPIIRQLVDGTAGRILTSLQQQQLSFEFSTETKPRQQRSSFLIYLNSLPEQEQKARAVVEDEFRKLISNPITDIEVIAARSCATAERVQHLRDHNNRTLAYAQYAFWGLPFTEVDNVAEKILAISKDDVKRVLQTYFAPEKRALGVIRSNHTPAQPAK